MNQPASSPPWSNEPVQYEDRIVAFFDVLGWKHLIGQAGADPTRLCELRSLVGLYGYFHQQIADGSQGEALSAFSDNVVVSQTYDAKGVQDFIDTIGRFQFAAALNGFFIRGAVTVGQLFHDRTCVFGPALIRAYELESKQAVYPRIILDPDKMDVFEASQRVHTVDGYSTIDTFGRAFSQNCATPTIAAATSLPSNQPPVSRMAVIPNAQLKIILEKVNAGIGSTPVEKDKDKLRWLKIQVEAGIASFR